MSRFLSILWLTIYATVFSQSEHPISFVQGNNTFVVTEALDSIVLDRGNFSLRYFAKEYNSSKHEFHAAQVAALTNEEASNYIKEGASLEDIPFFQPGTGMAPGENGKYESIIFSNEGHHYLMYEQSGDQRVDLISKSKKMNEYAWEIGWNDSVFQEVLVSGFYLVVFIDYNGNQQIDKQEAKVVKVNFKALE